MKTPNLFDTFSLGNREALEEFGIKIGKLYTNHGLPIDMGLAETKKRHPNLTQTEMLAILNGVCQWLVEHKHNSGATEKSIERQRDQNNKMIADYIKSGETGVY